MLPRSKVSKPTGSLSEIFFVDVFGRKSGGIQGVLVADAGVGEDARRRLRVRCDVLDGVVDDEILGRLQPERAK